MVQTEDRRRRSSVARTNESLWQRIVRDAKKKNPKWSARLAQQCVNEYKRQGGGYVGSQRSTSLNKWTREDWGYAGKKDKSRYLPKVVRDSLSPSLRQRENRAKGSRKGRNVPYSAQLNKKMRQFNIFS